MRRSSLRCSSRYVANVLTISLCLSAVSEMLILSHRLAAVRLDESFAHFSSIELISLELPSGLRSKPVVVLPFVHCQAFDRLPLTVASWETNPPCSRHSAGVHLIFYYSEDLDKCIRLKKQLLALVNGMSRRVRECFSGVQILSARLPLDQNTYPTGPCIQFYNSFRVLKSLGFTHWLQYEPDVIAVQSGWAERLVELTEQNSDCKLWWQHGSWPMYRNKVDNIHMPNTSSKDLHLNGNAIYCLVSPDFDEYRSKVASTFPPHGCTGPKAFTELRGYDHAMYQFRNLPENREYVRDKNSMFWNGGFIMNFGEAGYVVDELLAKHPSAMLVHGKYPFVSEPTRRHLDQKYITYNVTTKLNSLFQTTFRRYPVHSELHFFSRAFQAFHDDDDAMHCVLAATRSSCEIRSSSLPFLSMCGGLLYQTFDDPFKMMITGLYLRFAGVMPGPEAVSVLNLMRERKVSCHSVAQKISCTGCQIPLDDIITLQKRPTRHSMYYVVKKWVLLRKRLYQVLASSYRTKGLRTFFKRADETCQKADVVYSLVPINHVLESSYLSVCSGAHYVKENDELRCMWKGRTLTLPQPYRCAEDINVNRLSMQLDC